MTALFTLIKERTMQNPKDDVLYAPVEWVDHSEGCLLYTSDAADE